jgi:uncharacterized protein (DUF302 family)
VVAEKNLVLLEAALNHSEGKAMTPFFIVETSSQFDETCNNLKKAVINHGYGLLAMHDLGATLRQKHMSFSENCCVFEICDPEQAAKVLALDISVCMALPCRISVFTDNGETKMGMLKLADIVSDINGPSELTEVIGDVESAVTALMLEAASMNS